MTTDTKKRKGNNMLLAFITLLAAIVLIALVGFFILKPRPDIIQGQAEATEVRVSSKVPGRIQELRVKEGDWVNVGDTLVIIDSPEVRAKLTQAESARDAAQAQSSKAVKGAREETINTAYASWQKSKAGLDIAKKSFDRLNRLYEQGVVAAQKRDEAEANYLSMLATEQAAHSQYDMAVNGTEREDRAAAAALVNQARGAVDEVEAYLSETCLLSPISGEVSEVFPKTGELVGTGAPIMNIMDADDSWVVFNVREDNLKNMNKGDVVNAYVPALDRNITLSVYYLKDMGSYASWKATKANGQYDLKTFEVKARPQEPVEGLYPGMSVVIR